MSPVGNAADVSSRDRAMACALQRYSRMRRDDVRRARTFGERCAAAKAESLLGQISADEWPELWRREWLDDLGMAHLPELERRSLRDYANHAAAERWTKLLDAYLDRQVALAVDDDEMRAVKLVETLRDHLPPELSADREGARAFLQDRHSGEELTVTSLRHAWRMVDEWDHAS